MIEISLSKIVLAVIPPLFVLITILLNRKNSSPSLGVSLLLFFGGFFIAIPVGELNFFLKNRLDPNLAEGLIHSQFIRIIVDTFLATAACEEAFKALIVLACFRGQEVLAAGATLTRKKGALAGVIVGSGYAGFENIYYSYQATLNVILRGVTALPLHIICAGIVGCHLIRSPDSGKRSLWRGLLITSFVHGLYNLLLFSRGWISLLTLPLLILAAVQLLWRPLKEDSVT